MHFMGIVNLPSPRESGWDLNPSVIEGLIPPPAVTVTASTRPPELSEMVLLC